MQDLVSDRNALRLQKFAEKSSALSPSIAPVASGVSNHGVTQFSSPAVSDALADGELDDDEMAALQEAADAGDEEASNLLKYLTVGAGAAITAAGAGYGGMKLYQALRRRSNVQPLPVDAVAGLPATYDPPVTRVQEEVMPRNPSIFSSEQAMGPKLLTGPKPQLSKPTSVDTSQPRSEYAEYYQQRRNRNDAQMKSAEKDKALEHRDYYKARRAKARAKAASSLRKAATTIRRK